MSYKKHYIHETFYLSGDQVNQLFYHVYSIYDSGLTLNRFITIRLNEVEPRDAQKIITKILGYTRKWLTRHGQYHAHVWVLEEGRNMGLHVHILAYIPPSYVCKYKRLLKKWLPFNCDNDTIRIQAVRDLSGYCITREQEIYNLLRYICKGVDPSAISLPIQPDRKAQGKILGRRCGHSSPVRPRVLSGQK